MASKETLKAIFRLLTAVYPTFALNENTFEGYCGMLEDVDDELLRAATLEHTSKSRFFPTVAELRDAAYVIRTNRVALPSAYEAWQEVTEQVRVVGSWGAPTWSHPWVESAVRQVGGYRHLCQSENPIADRARFMDAYADAERRNDHAAKTLPAVTELAKRLGEKHRLALTGGQR